MLKGREQFNSDEVLVHDRSRIEDTGKGIERALAESGSDADAPTNRTDALQATPLQATSLGMI
jgi:hypothetical protein